MSNLAYASTAHRIQGRTVDTAHALVSAATTREVLYVAATRGRHSNRLYVDTAYDPDPQTGHDGALKPQTARDVLAAVLASEGAEISAHETIRRAHHDAESWTTLHAEYQTIAQAAQADRWNTLVDRSGLTPDEIQQVHASDAYGPLVAALTVADSRGLAIETAFPRLVQGRTLDDADDIASVLHGRVGRWTEGSRPIRGHADNLIAGLVPRARGVADPDAGRALQERDQSMEQRARALAEQAVTTGATWLRRLGATPAEPALRDRWLREASTVAAYRERWNVGHDHRPLGPDATSIEQLGQRRRALAAIDRARTLSSAASPRPKSRTPAQLPELVNLPIGSPEL